MNFVKYPHGRKGELPFQNFLSVSATVAVATDREAFVQNSTDQNRSLASSFTSFFFSSAHAEGENYSLCDEPGITCCPVVDGKITDGAGREACFVPLTDTSVSQIYIAGLDENAELTSQVVEEKINGNLLYIADVPVDGVFTSSGMMSLSSADTASSERQIVQLSKNSLGNYQTQGDHTSNYQHSTATENSRQIVFDSTNSLINFRNTSSGILETRLESSGAVVSTGSTYTQPHALKYTFMRSLSDNTLYGIEEESTSSAYLYYTRSRADTLSNSSTSGSYFDSQFSSSTSSNVYRDRIPFILCRDLQDANSCDRDDSGHVLTHTKTIAFDYVGDVMGDPLVVVAYSDGNNLRVRMTVIDETSANAIRFGGGTPILDARPESIKDIRFLTDQTSLTKDATVGLLDNKNNKVWLVDYNIDSTNPKLTFDKSKYLTTGKAPVAMVLDSEKKHLIVLNKNDESLSFFSLKNSNGRVRTTPLSLGTTKLKSFVNKEIVFSPNSLVLEGENLFVGAQNIKSYLVVPLASHLQKLSSGLADESVEEKKTTIRDDDLVIPGASKKSSPVLDRVIEQIQNNQNTDDTSKPTRVDSTSSPTKKNSSQKKSGISD